MGRISLSLQIVATVSLAKLTMSAMPVHVATAKPSYYPGENLEILITITNPASLSFPTSLQTSYSLDAVYTPGGGALGIETSATTPKTWTNIHSWSEYNLSPGTHTVVGTVSGYGTSAPATFNVVPAPTPQGDFLVNFDTIPGTTAPIAHLMAYGASGVHFHTSQGAPCRLQNVQGNQNVEADSWVEGFDPYPIGFHVIADFDRPVFGARADVAGGTGVRITMTAKNALGEILDTSISPPITQPGKFVQMLSVRAAEPIASLEWRPSIPNSMAGVDNLFINTIPILSYCIVGQAYCLTWPTLAGTSYQLWSSTNLQTWTPHGPIRVGTGGMLTNEDPLGGSAAQFFRISQSP